MFMSQKYILYTVKFRVLEKWKITEFAISQLINYLGFNSKTKKKKKKEEKMHHINLSVSTQ